MPEKTRKAKKTSQKRKQKYITFSAYPEEIIVWKGVAAGLDRSLSWWIRNMANKAAKEAGAALPEIEGLPVPTKNNA